MKKMMYIRLKIAVCAILLSATMFSCVKEEIAESQMTYGDSIRFGISSANDKKGQPKTKSGAVESEPYVIHGEGITATVTVVDGIQSKINDMPLTKGTQATSVSAFNVAAYLYPDGATSGVDYFSDLVSDGVNPATTRYWPEFGTLDFLAAAPAGIISTMPSASDYENGFSFTYAISEEVADQQDIMVAVAKDQNNSSTGNPVPLQFQHLLAAVQFKVGKMIATRINTLTISGIKGGDVVISYNPESDSWNCSSTQEVSYSPIFTVNGTPNIDTYGLAEGNFITSNDNGMTMFVMPQELVGAKISVNYTELITGTTHDSEAELSGHSWIAGHTTIYKLDVIAETLQITIPSPPDADAHYVRIDMEYDLTGLSNYTGEGITISNVIATTRWEDDGSNTASDDKQDIYIKNELTEMQKEGFFTDELWGLEYSVDENGNKSYTLGSANGPEIVNNNILGTKTLDLTSGSKGTIYLFLDENNGTTDRNGVLEVKATVTQNGISRKVILGSGKFKQLAPSWNTAGVGVERFEDNGTYPYGFSYNRVVTYTNPRALWFEDVFTNGNWLEQIGAAIYYLILRFTGSLADSVLPDTEGIAEGFVTVSRYSGTITKVVLDYSKLNSVKAIAESEYGMDNTAALYNYTGQTDIADFENQVDESFGTPSEGGAGTNWNKEITTAGANPVDYAAFIALICNRMREVKTVITENGGSNSDTRYNAVLHRIGEGGTDGNGDESGAAIIEWYLPSYQESVNLKETGTGNETTKISPLNGTYWSSTAGADPTAGTNGYAYSYTYSNNGYVSYSASADRTTELKVRAVRKKPTAN